MCQWTDGWGRTGGRWGRRKRRVGCRVQRKAWYVKSWVGVKEQTKKRGWDPEEGEMKGKLSNS
jgi:hypothetical protein